jgi:thiol-disulfide isomerase/thioredoxin
MKLKTCLMAALCLLLQANAQTKSTHQFLTVGDQVPDILITSIINSNFKTARISDYKGKILILDFWNTWCSSCIAGFPDWYTMQHQYPKDLQVFLVNKKNKMDTEKGIKNVINLTSETIGKPFRIPVVLSDTTLVKYFEFNTVPHTVWIDRNGVVIAITGKKEVTAANIAKVISGEHVNFPVKTIRDFN